MATRVPHTITAQGMDQESLVAVINNLIAVANELQTDHATTKSAVDSQKSVLGDVSLTSAGLAIGTTSKKEVKIANTVTFLIGGLFKAKTTAEVAFTATTHDVADGSTAFYVLSLNGSGTCTITKGADDAALSTITVPADNAVIGYLSIAASGAIFDATSDDLDAVHLTVTYVNASYLEQQISDGPATLTNSTAVSLNEG